MPRLRKGDNSVTPAREHWGGQGHSHFLLPPVPLAALRAAALWARAANPPLETLPRHAPRACVYLFSEESRSLYPGRTRNLPQRMRQQSLAGTQHNQAALAFKLASEAFAKPLTRYVK